MGTNYTAGTIGTGVGQQSAINAEITAIQAALERMLNIYGDNTNGANAMQAALDMNSQRILNVPAPTLSTDVVRLGDLSVADAASALTTTITDAAAKYASDNVEGALAEILTLIEYVSGAGLYAAASGVDTITATLSPAPTVLTNGMEVHIRAAGANTSATPTLNLNGLGAKTITKLGGQALLVGDIPRANYEMVLRYNSSSSAWELLNPSVIDVLASTATDDRTKGFHLVYYPRSAAEVAAGVTPVNYEYSYGKLERYGTNTTPGTTNMTTAFENLILVTINDVQDLGGFNAGGTAIELPGELILVDNNVFASFSVGSVVRNITVKGQGWYNTSLVLSGDGAFIDISSSKALFWKFSDICFYGDTNYDDAPTTTALTANRKFAHFNIGASDGLAQFRFYNCAFSRFAETFVFEGDNQESEIKFYGCLHRKSGDWMVITNQQTFSNEHYGCEFEQYVGSLVSFPASDYSGDAGGTAGGGCVRFFGGSIIPFDGGSQKYLVDVKAGSAASAQPAVVIHNARVELRGDNNGICNIASAVSAQVRFNQVTFLTGTSSGGNKKMASVGAYGAIHFGQCIFAESGTSPTYQWELKGHSAAYHVKGKIEFVGCRGNQPYSDNVIRTNESGTNYGVVISRDAEDDNPASGSEAQEALNFTVGIDNFSKWPGQTKQPLPLHRQLLVRIVAPYNTGQTATIKLPKRAMITRIFLLVDPTGASTSSITYTLQDGAATSFYSETVPNQKDGLFWDLTPADLNGGFSQAVIGTTDNERTLSLSADAGAHTASPAYGYIEYI